MELVRLLSQAPSHIVEGWRENGWEGLRYGLNSFWRAPFIRAYSRYCNAYIAHAGNPGTAIWDRDWDILLVLDACRVDLMEEVQDEYDFIDSIDVHQSLGSMSRDWMERNFSEEYATEVIETAYVTGNPFSRKFDFDFSIFDEVWEYDWDEEKHTIPPRPLTDRAIDTWRNDQPERMIVHYMQPHGPFLDHPELGTYGDPEDFGTGFGSLWSEAGHTIPIDDVWEAYRDNLRAVLDDVELFLQSVDADTVAISADHGNAIGELGLYGHPDDALIDVIRNVPWVETTASAAKGYQPETTVPDEIEKADVEERLRSLGYAE